MQNLVFSCLPDPAIAHCINQMNWSLLNCFQSTKIPLHWYGYGEIRIWLNVPLKDMLMKRVRVEEFGESKDEDCGWVSVRLGSVDAFAFAFFYSFFSFHSFRDKYYCYGYCSWIVTAKFDLSNNFQPISAHRVLFTDPQISLFSKFFIKNGSHGTIYSFKNYFVTVFFSFQFQFSVFNCIQTDPQSCFSLLFLF